MNKALKIGMVALGQCGTTVGNLFPTKLDIPIMSINTTYNDAIRGTNIKNRYLIFDGEIQGMAKKPENISIVVKNEEEKFMKKLASFIEDHSLEGLVLICGSGGGTGNGLMKEIVKRLDGQIRMRCIVITPEFREGIAPIENTLTLLTELQNFDTAIRVISNNNYLRDANEIKRKETINRYILNTEFEFFISGSKESLTNNFDYAEISDLMFNKGFTSIYHLNLKDLKNGTSELISKTKKSFDVEINSNKVIGSCAYIYKGSRDTLLKIDETVIEETLGTPTYKYSSLYENSEEKIYFVVSECEIPNILLNYKEEHKKLAEAKKQMQLIDLQVESVIQNNTTENKLEIKVKPSTLKLNNLKGLKGKISLELK